MPHYLIDYETELRACFAIMDDFGNAVPCKHSTYFYLFPQWQFGINWNNENE